VGGHTHKKKMSKAERIPITEEDCEFFASLFQEDHEFNIATDLRYTRVLQPLLSLFIGILARRKSPYLLETKEIGIAIKFYTDTIVRVQNRLIKSLSFCAEDFDEHPNLGKILKNPGGYERERARLGEKPFQVKKLLTVEDLWTDYLIIVPGKHTPPVPVMEDLIQLYMYYRERYCAWCNAMIPKTTERCLCGYCESHRYCNETCQRADWVNHKPFCRVKWNYEDASQSFTKSLKYRDVIHNRIFPFMRHEISWENLTSDEQAYVFSLRYRAGKQMIIAIYQNYTVFEPVPFVRRLFLFGTDEELFGKKIDWAAIKLPSYSSSS
jgi:hypothetical protein